MIIKELIERLKNLDGNLRVVTNGFDECEIDDIETVELIKIVLNAGHGGHSGEHTQVKDYNKDEFKDKKIIDAVFIDF